MVPISGPIGPPFQPSDLRSNRPYSILARPSISNPTASSLDSNLRVGLNPFAVLIASQPLDANPTAAASSSSSCPPLARVRAEPWQRSGQRRQVTSAQAQQVSLCSALNVVVHRPRKSSCHLLPLPSVLPWQSRHPRLCCRCSRPPLAT